MWGREYCGHDWVTHAALRACCDLSHSSAPLTASLPPPPPPPMMSFFHLHDCCAGLLARLHASRRASWRSRGQSSSGTACTRSATSTRGRARSRECGCSGPSFGARRPVLVSEEASSSSVGNATCARGCMCLRNPCVGLW